MALSLAEKGWAIALHYRNSLEEAESTREKIEEAGSDCKLFSADLENPRDSVEMMKQVLSEFPDLDLLQRGGHRTITTWFRETRGPLWSQKMKLRNI